MCGIYEIYDAIIKTISLVVACKAAKIVYCQWQEEIKANRAEQLMELLDRTRCDEVAQVFSVIDWDVANETGLTYDKVKKFQLGSGVKAKYPDLHENNIEFRIDRMLGLYSHICYLYSKGITKDEDMQIFAYRINRISQHPAITDYLFSLYHFSVKQNTEMSFMPLVDYCIESGKLDKDFKKRDCGKYHCCLNA